MPWRPTTGRSGPPSGVEIEILESESPEREVPGRELPEGGPTGAPAEGRRDGHRRRVPGRRMAAAVVIGVLVAAANVVELRRDEARAAALALVPGVRDPLSGPVGQQWQVEGSWLGGEVGGLLLVHDRRGIRAVDPATGTVRWERPTPEDSSGEHCRPVEDAVLRAVDDSVRARPAAAGPAQGPPLVVCQAQGTGARGRGQSARPPRISVVDGASGSQLRTFAPEGTLIGIEPIGEGDLLAVVSTPDRHLGAIRWDARSGEQLWDYRSPQPVFGTDVMDLRQLEQRGDVLLVVALTAAAFDTRTGEDVPADLALRSDEPAWYETVRLDRGETAVWSYGAPGHGAGQLRDASGRERYPLPGPVWRPPVHDGSVPEVLVVGPAGKGGLRGLDRATGAVLWSSDRGTGWPLLQLDGVLVLSDGATVDALDVRDGSLLWSVPAARGGSSATTITDGTVVLLMRRDDSGAPLLAAHDLADGTQAWRVTLPPGTRTVTGTSGGAIVASVDGGFVGVG